MIHFYRLSFLNINILSHYKFYQVVLAYFSCIFIILFFNSCAPSERFTKKGERTNKTPEETEVLTSEVRIMLNEVRISETINIQSSVYLYDQSSRLNIIKAGDRVECFVSDGNPVLNVAGKNYKGKKFLLSSVENGENIIKINGRSYRGKLQISSSSNSIDLINIVNLEDYVKGVLPREMPLGKNNENYEALKSLAICIRTYAVRKMQDGKIYFDLFDDTRDQVYGGLDAENPLSNKAVEETRNLILKYDRKPALLFYHSTCGGHTESSENVFTKDRIPYLLSIKDGNEPYCKISPRYQWEEVYKKDVIINRLKNYSLLGDYNYELEDIIITKKFESGRVSEMEVIISDDAGADKSLVLRGNEIRNILRTADNKNILWSTLFDVSMNSGSVLLKGRGFGHGVGLCQWGAIALSRKGWNYTDILAHYYPGTEIGNIND